MVPHQLIKLYLVSVMDQQTEDYSTIPVSIVSLPCWGGLWAPACSPLWIYTHCFAPVTCIYPGPNLTFHCAIKCCSLALKPHSSSRLFSPLQKCFEFCYNHFNLNSFCKPYTHTHVDICTVWCVSRYDLLRLDKRARTHIRRTTKGGRITYDKRLTPEPPNLGNVLLFNKFWHCEKTQTCSSVSAVLHASNTEEREALSQPSLFLHPSCPLLLGGWSPSILPMISSPSHSD